MGENYNEHDEEIMHSYSIGIFYLILKPKALLIIQLLSA